MEEFRPVKPEKDVISLRISSGLLQELERYAAASDISRNERINQCIRFALDHMGQLE